MNDMNLSELILDKSQDLIYLADIDTYALYYLNTALKKVLGNPAEEVWKNTPCHKLLHNFDTPCNFCTNKYLVEDVPYVWTHYDKNLNKWFSVRNTKFVHDDRNIHFGASHDITNLMKDKEKLHNTIEQDRILLDCVSLLHSHTQPEEAIHRLLELIGSFHDADRAFVFDIDNKNQLIYNSFEWVKDTSIPKRRTLQGLDFNYFKYIFDELEKQPSLYIRNVDLEIDRDMHLLTHSMFKEFQVDSVIMSAVKDRNGELIALLGVDNPQSRKYAESLLTAISYFIADFKDKQSVLNQLHLLSHTDGITALKNSYSYRIEVDLLENKPPKTCGIAFIDINELKHVNDTQGHEAGDALIKKVASFLFAEFPEQSYRTGGDEFVILAPNCSRGEFYESLTKIQAKVDGDQDIHVSLGHLWTDDFSEGIKKYIKITDQEMYLRKREYYAKKGHDRRKR